MKSSWRSEFLSFVSLWSVGLWLAGLLGRSLFNQQLDGNAWLIMLSGGVITALIVTITKSERLPQLLRPLIWATYFVVIIVFILLRRT
jgi:hypothetical protein